VFAAGRHLEKIAYGTIEMCVHGPAGGLRFPVGDAAQDGFVLRRARWAHHTPLAKLGPDGSVVQQLIPSAQHGRAADAHVASELPEDDPLTGSSVPSTIIALMRA
jgi:hypothetical protein